MQIISQTLAVGRHEIRPVIKLALGTVRQAFGDFDPARAFADLDGFVIYMPMVRLEQAGLDVPAASRIEPGRVGQRKADRVLTSDVHYNEINMVCERVAAELPGGRDMPASRDYLDTFTTQIEAAVAPMIAWCDRKKSWADRAAFTDRWTACLDALRAGRLSRPHEFTTRPQIRDALNVCWPLVEETALESEPFEPLAEAYYLLRDVGWADADYGEGGRLGNFAANLAAAPAPDAGHGYIPY